jgi:dGTPase
VVEDAISSSVEAGLDEVRLSPGMLGYVESLREFLFENVYETPIIRDELVRARKIIEELYQLFMREESLFLQEIGEPDPSTARERQVCDHIAGMTDRYALDLYKRLFLPRPWMKL